MLRTRLRLMTTAAPPPFSPGVGRGPCDWAPGGRRGRRRLRGGVPPRAAQHSHGRLYGEGVFVSMYGFVEAVEHNLRQRRGHSGGWVEEYIL